MGLSSSQNSATLSQRSRFSQAVSNALMSSKWYSTVIALQFRQFTKIRPDGQPIRVSSSHAHLLIARRAESARPSTAEADHWNTITRGPRPRCAAGSLYRATEDKLSDFPLAVL